MLKRALIAMILSALPVGVCQAQERIDIPSDESSLSGKEAGDLDQELEFLQSDQENQPQQNTTPPASPNRDKSPTDALSEGLESLFSEKNKQDGTVANQADASTSPGAPSGHFTQYAMLQGLNKITARTSSLDMAMQAPVTFGTLEITVHKCWKAAPEEAQENKALMEIWEKKPGEDKSRIFYGWMFSSTPSISALESPIYDITVLECTDNKPAE